MKRVQFGFNRKAAKATVGGNSVPTADERSESVGSSRTRVRTDTYTGTHTDAAARPSPKGEGNAHSPARTHAHVKVDELREMLAGLTSAERLELLDSLALENQLTRAAASNPDLDMWSEAVKRALDDVIGGSGGESHGLMLVKRALGSSSVWRPVESFMYSSKLSELKRAERLAVYFMFARLLVEECRQLAAFVDAPLSVKFVAGKTGELAGIVDKSFPGYAANGLLPMVAKQMRFAA